jgi:hypothetical protein
LTLEIQIRPSVAHGGVKAGMTQPLANGGKVHGLSNAIAVLWRIE